MITTGKIIAINQNLGSFEGNAYEIELPMLNAPGDTAAEIVSKHIKATASLPGGHYNFYQVGDFVYVDFLHDLLSEPIIIGKIYQGLGKGSAGDIQTEALTVVDNARLPLDTTIGDIDGQTLRSALIDITNLLARVDALENPKVPPEQP